ncbi:MAG TPA: aminotransferase class I/II-fold pyridoxal phosphate-dependent enzyme [Acetobacteraceae bacterium]|nr:aminotransferase class I/II-fold pyridoxal phosphate-dependent enzyme [Acetobacteraceae bacterium]
MSRFDALFAARLEALATRSLRRSLTPVLPDAPGSVRRGGRLLLNVSANDYLGLARHPALAERAAAWAQTYGTGAGASRLVCGTLALHEQVEAKLARLKGTEAALIFASGWQANATILPALFQDEAGEGEALVFTDRLNHASLHHGCRAAGVRQHRYRHNDLNHLEDLLAASAGKHGRRFIVTESVFSMDGDRADIAGLKALADRHGAFLYLDEAHATGVLGPGGAGLAGAAGGGVDLVMGTFSKALGGFGAYVAGSRVLCDYLLNACSGFIHTTAPPPPVLGAIDAALDLLPGMDRERAWLAEAGERVRGAFRAAGIETGASSTQIIPAILGDEAATLGFARALEEAGLLAIAIRPPTVPAGTSRIRFALSAAHDAEAVARVCDIVTRLWAERGGRV